MGLPQFKPKLIESFQTKAHNYIPFSAAKSIYFFKKIQLLSKMVNTLAECGVGYKLWPAAQL